MEFHAKTIFSLLLLVNVVIALFLSLFKILIKIKSPKLYLYGLAKILQAITVAAIIYRDITPYYLSLVLSNIPVYFGLGLEVSMLSSFGHKSFKKRTLFFMALPALFSIFYLLNLGSDVNIRVFVTYLVFTIMLLLGGIDLTTVKPARGTKRAIGILMVLTSCITLLRSVDGYFSSNQETLFRGEFTEILVFTTFFLVTFVLSISFFFLLKEEDDLIINENEALLDKLFIANPLATTLINLNTMKYERVNDVFTNKLEYTKNEVIGKTPVEIGAIAEDQQEPFYKNLLEKGYLYNTEIKFITKNKTFITALFFAEIIEQKGIKYIYSTFIDITEQKKAEEKLIDSNEKFSAAFNKSSIGQLITTIPDGRIYEANKAVSKLTGYQQNEMKNQTIVDLGFWLSKSDRDAFFNEIREQGFIQDKEYKFRIKNKQIRTCRISSNIIKLSGEDFLLSSIIDITDLKNTEAKLKESEMRWQFSVDGSGLGLWDWNIVTDEMYFSPQWKNMLGITDTEIKGNIRELEKRIHPEDLQNMLTDFNAHFAGKTPIYLNEHRVLCKNGQYKWVLDRGKVVSWSKDGKPERIIGTNTDIDIQKKNQHIFIESIAKFKLLFEQSPIGIYISDIKGNIIDGNQKLLELLSSPSIEATKKINVLKFTPLVENGYAEIFKKCLDTGKKQQLEMLYTSTWGKKTYLSSYIVPLLGSNGDIQHVYTLMEDISERKRIEQELKDSQYRLELFFSQSAIGFFFMMLDKPVEWDENTDKDKTLEYVFSHQRLTKVNEAMLRYFGVKKEDIIGLTPMDFYKDEQKQRKEFWKTLFDRGKLHVDTKETRFDGSNFIVAGDYICMHDSQKRIIGHFGLMSDVTAEREAQKALKISEEKFKNIVESANDWIWEIDANGLFTYSSPQIKEILGYQVDEIIGKTAFDFMPEDEAKRISKTFVDIAINNKPLTNIENINLHKDGHQVILETSGMPFFDANKNLLGYRGIDRDVTENRKAVIAMRKSEEMLKKAQKVAKMGYWNYDIINNSITWSDQIYEILGFDAKSYAPTLNDIFNFIHPEDRKMVKETYDKSILSKEDHHIIFRVVLKDETIKYISEYFNTIFDKKGTPLASIGTIQDITELKENEKKLLEAKQEAEKANRLKSEFLASMSHEIRTPMNAVLGYSEILANKLSDNPEYLSYANGINKSGKNLISLINDILDLSKIEAGKLDIIPEPVNFRELIEDIQQIFAANISKKHLNFSISIDNKLPGTLMLDKTRIRQILFNLVGNAIKFTNKGGVDISVRADEDKMGLKSKIDLFFKVEDTGIGIQQGQLCNIFEAFRQTHGQNSQFEGTGLGLAISKRLVEAMNGDITVESKVGKGSAFSVYLKEVEIASQVNDNYHADKNSNIRNVMFKRPWILLVDDIESNLMVTQNILLGFNCKIKLAPDGKEALSAIKQQIPDLILMDIQMPGLNGYETTKIIKDDAKYKHIPVIALTALALNEQMEKFAGVFDDYLTKPTEVKKLVECLMKYLPFEDIEENKRTKKTKTVNALDLNGKLPKQLISNFNNEIIPMFNELKEYFDTDDCLNFTDKLANLIRGHGLSQIERFCADLTEATKNMHLDKIQELMSSFDTFCEQTT